MHESTSLKEQDYYSKTCKTVIGKNLKFDSNMSN